MASCSLCNSVCGLALHCTNVFIISRGFSREVLQRGRGFDVYLCYFPSLALCLIFIRFSCQEPGNERALYFVAEFGVRSACVVVLFTKCQDICRNTLSEILSAVHSWNSSALWYLSLYSNFGVRTHALCLCSWYLCVEFLV
jgi:hypothetical protein